MDKEQYLDNLVKLKTLNKSSAAIESVLSKTDPHTLLATLDKMTPKYKWGDFAHPIEILRQLRRTIEPGWPEWEPETLIRHVVAEYGELDQLTIEKILALQTALATDVPWNDFDVFENTCLAFTNNIPEWGVVEPLDLHEMAFGVGVLDAIRDEEYGDEVKGYIASTLVYNGVICQPKDSKLPNVKPYLNRLLDEEGQELSAMYEREWLQGNRSTGDEEDPVEVQMDKLQTIEEWYDAGYNYSR